ncbi:MAG: glyoxalase [Pseudonocardiaceae bacterium]|nr:glyoxalase [Pseudonocardiaceae bacterium]
MRAADELPLRFGGVSPYLYYEDAAEAVAWLTEVFGFTEAVRYVDPDGGVFEARVAAGDAKIMLAGVGPGYWRAKGTHGPVGQLVVVYVNDVRAHHARVRAAGVDAPAPVDQPYGARVYTVSDPGGNSWCFWQRLRDEVELPPGWREVRP